MEKKDITFKIIDNFDGNDVFDERNNTLLAVRKVEWNNTGNEKLELRKWIVNQDGVEMPNKGFSFLTEEGPNTLINILIRAGYGDTDDILGSLMTRESKDDLIKRIKYYEDNDMGSLIELEADELLELEDKGDD